MQITAKFRKVCASVAVAGVAMLGLIPAAYADEPAGAAAAAAPLPSTINRNDATLIIHKHEQPDTPGQPADGLVKPDVEKPIQGVVFTATKVGSFDLKTNAGWEAAAKVIDQFKRDGNIGSLQLGDVHTFSATNVGGSAQQTLPIGVYLIRETETVNAQDAEGHSLKVVKAAPFLVTLPTVNPNTREWNYDVNVYPKNTPLTGTKTVEDDRVNLGDKATFTITTDIPYIEGNKSLEKYVVIDQLPTGMAFKAAAGDVVVSLTAGGQSLDEHDYQVSEADHNPVTVTFLAPGLQKLADARRADAAAKVKVVLKAEITAFEANGYHNEAFFAPSNDYSTTPRDPQNPPIPTTTTDTKLGQISINKFSVNDGAKNKLAGATFKLAYCDQPDRFLTINGQNQWTTVANQALVIQGLHISTHYNGKTQETAREYCLFETVAPAGFQLPPEPYKFNLTEEHTADALSIDIPNVPVNGGIELPLTGSQALGILTAAGVFLVVGSFAFLGGRRRAAK